MAPIQTQPSKLFTRDIAAFYDAELDRYLEANGGDIAVEDPENLKKDEVLLQRLRARAGAQSRPIDLDDLTARLQAASADRDAPPRSPSLATSATTIYDEEEMYRLALEEETECYNTLVHEGGRPSHPVSLGRDILDNPGEYREILSYWQSVHRSGSWRVFGCQMGEWRRFRRYQQYERKEGRFPRYRQRVQERLTRHGFERPFRLDEGLNQPDKLATWIEFLNYEYQDYDKDMRFVERLQQQYDEAWKELVDSQVLRPSETEEFICNIKSAFQRASEKERAEKAVESAKSAVMLAQKAIPDPRRTHLSQQATQQMLAAAQSQLDAAIKSLESIKRRSYLIHKFLKKTKLDQITNDGKLKRSYQSAKDDAERRSILLRWILQQIPLIELELNQAMVAENDSGGEDGRNRLKRNPADDLNPERVSKRRREDGGNDALSKRRTRASTTPTTFQDSSSTQRQPQIAGHEGQLKRNCHDSTDEERAPKRPRHNGQKTSTTAESISIGEPLSIQLDRSEPDNSVAQVQQEPRKSRRIAGHLPEFGMLPKRGEPAPLYVPPSRYPSNTRKPNPSSPRSRASSKKSIPTKFSRSSKRAAAL